jgi:hypothetical protein
MPVVGCRDSKRADCHYVSASQAYKALLPTRRADAPSSSQHCTAHWGPSLQSFKSQCLGLQTFADCLAGDLVLTETSIVFQNRIRKPIMPHRSGSLSTHMPSRTRTDCPEVYNESVALPVVDHQANLISPCAGHSLIVLSSF